MKKVFLIHGFEGFPSGGWRPWLMSELIIIKNDGHLSSESGHNALPEVLEKIMEFFKF